MLYKSIFEITGHKLKSTKNKWTKGETLEEHFQLVFMLRELGKKKKTLHQIKAIINISISRIRMIIDSAIYKEMKFAGWKPDIMCSPKPPCQAVCYDTALIISDYKGIMALFDDYDREYFKTNDDKEV